MRMGVTPFELGLLARLTRDLPRVLRHPISVEQAAAIVRERLRLRETRFLEIVQGTIYGNARSPYLRLLKFAGCELGDLRALIAREGLDGALTDLAEHGVYVSFDEFKGQREVVRGSQRFSVAEEDFNQPWLRPHLVYRTGGTRSQGSLVPMSLDFVVDMVPNTLLALDAHGLTRAAHVPWETVPFFQFVRLSKAGIQPYAWFHPVRPLHWKARALGFYWRWLGRTFGQRFPGPVWNDLTDPGRLAAWLGERQAEGRAVCVIAYASSAVRVAVAAAERGIELNRVSFLVHGEPFTEGKQRAVSAAGARALVRYSQVECGTFGYSCTEARRPDDVHFCTDSFAFIQQPRRVGELGVEIGVFLMTSLLPTAPKILLNTENGDYGVIERRECGCPLGSLGLDVHLSDIRSHEKLTGEGMTFLTSRVVEVVEEVLPGRFGGSSADYQLVEEEAANGILRVALLAHPRLGPLDEALVREAFFAELGRGTELEAYMAQVWRRAGTVEIRRQAPMPTGAGKILSFHLASGRR